MKRRSVGQLIIGKRHPGHPRGKFVVTISNTQARKLFGTERLPTPIGCGVFACAYPHKDPDKVVKITRDHSDVAALTRAQGLKHVPKLYSAHALKSPIEWERKSPRDRLWMATSYGYQFDRPPAYALVVERLKPLPRGQHWSRRISCARETIKRIIVTRKVRGQISKAHVKRLISCCPTFQKDARKCRSFLRNLTRTALELDERRIKWTDIHRGNIGMGKDGTWKALDLGLTRLQIKKPLKQLAGVRRR